MSAQPGGKPDTRPSEPTARAGLWALPVWAALLLVGTFSHQPPPQTQLGAWSRYVTTPWFVASHLIASILGTAVGTVGMIALAVCLIRSGRVRGGAWGMVLAVTANILLTAVFGIAAFAQPAIGRLYLAGHAALAHMMYDGAAQGAWLVVTGVTGVVLMAASLIVFGVAVARSGWLPRLAGIGLAIAGPVLVVGFALDDFIETVAAVLLVACTAWIADAARRAASAEKASAGLAELAS